MVNPEPQHSRISITQAANLQRELAGKVVEADGFGEVKLVAGVDISGVRSGVASASAVLLSFPELTLLEESKAEGPLDFPYVPGFLSFREAPLMQQALEGLSRRPDITLVDGQGRAHPRRLGIASHLGLILDLPTIGCAKSRLVGQYLPPDDEAGAASPLLYQGEVIGSVLRTKKGVKPVFVSVGHRVSLDTALALVMRCTLPRYRIPEPTRQAHIAAGSRTLGGSS